jgi:alkylated DNA repair dioxygenase AlkB
MSLFSDTDLFSSGAPRRIPYLIPDGDMLLIEHFFPKEEADRMYERLLNHIEWKQGAITLYGKEHQTPRLTAWYGDKGKSYTFSGTRLEPLPWTEDLLAIRQRVEKEAGVLFNSVLLNLYRSGQDSVGWHRDDEPEFGANPVIASVSFGESRPFQFRHKFKKEAEKLSIPLHHGSLLIMKGTTQHFWEHQIPKTVRHIRPRINLTFRIIKSVIPVKQ